MNWVGWGGGGGEAHNSVCNMNNLIFSCPVDITREGRGRELSLVGVGLQCMQEIGLSLCFINLTKKPLSTLPKGTLLPFARLIISRN